jgi:hypothetical protein
MNFDPLPSAFGSTIFCDDIRQEVDGKLMILGAYGSDMNINAEFPVSLPKFCALVTYNERVGAVSDPASLLLFMPGDDEDNPTIRADIPIEQARADAPHRLVKREDYPETPDPVIVFRAPIVMSPCIIRSTGVVRIRMRLGDRYVKLGALQVNRAPVELVPGATETAET